MSYRLVFDPVFASVWVLCQIITDLLGEGVSAAQVGARDKVDDPVLWRVLKMPIPGNEGVAEDL